MQNAGENLFNLGSPNYNANTNTHSAIGNTEMKKEERQSSLNPMYDEEMLPHLNMPLKKYRRGCKTIKVSKYISI
jgi:hypothetical protein